MEKIMNRMRKSKYFNIPNLLGYLRLILIPVFLFLYVNSYYTPSFIVLVVSFLSDFVDGKVARRFDMITDFGKILDPIADKLTQLALVIAITFKHPFMMYFLIFFVIKEFYMGIMGLYLIKKGKGVNGAQMYGKICTGVIDICSLILLIFTDMSYFTGVLIISVMMVMAVISLVCYIRFHISVLTKGDE